LRCHRRGRDATMARCPITQPRPARAALQLRIRSPSLPAT